MRKARVAAETRTESRARQYCTRRGRRAMEPTNLPGTAVPATSCPGPRPRAVSRPSLVPVPVPVAPGPRLVSVLSDPCSESAAGGRRAASCAGSTAIRRKNCTHTAATRSAGAGARWCPYTSASPPSPACGPSSISSSTVALSTRMTAPGMFCTHPPCGYRGARVATGAHTWLQGAAHLRGEAGGERGIRDEGGREQRHCLLRTGAGLRHLDADLGEHLRVAQARAQAVAGRRAA
jgi:hypothetical protein